MPVLLAPEQAPSLTSLLASVNAAGLNTRIADNSRPDPVIRGIGSLQQAGPDEISFLSNPRLKAELDRCQAAVVIVPPDVFDTLKDRSLPYGLVACDQPYLLYALLAQWFDRHRIGQLPVGIHPTAIVHESAQLESNVHIGDNCVIGNNVLIKNTIIGNNVRILDGSIIGKKGFGFFPDKNINIRYPHIGMVIIKDNAEIGCNNTIDRGSLSNTIIGSNTFLDNQVHVAHNVKIGNNCIITGQVGFAGSSTIGDNVSIGGQAGISGHLKIGSNVQIGGGSGVIKNIPNNSRVMGYPAKNIRSFLKENK